MTNNNQSVYIQSLQASDIYSSMIRGYNINDNYVGMIPYSLELIKLHDIGLKVRKTKTSSKQLSDDIINVKFNQKVQSGEYIIKRLKERVEGLEDDKGDYSKKLQEFIQTIESELVEGDKWNEVSNFELRDYLYENGFYLNDVKYVVYKRSSSKSRTGQCLFIRDDMRDEMIKWSRMKLNFKRNDNVDLASLLAYESLVGSSIVDTIQIPADKILIVDDVISKFNQVANVVRTDKSTGYLDSFKENTEIGNDIFDGQSLLDSSYFTNKKGFMQLRNHMFKSAAFNVSIQQFLQDNCPANVKFDEWKIKDMFGNEMYAKDVHMITTPNSLKALKFSYLLDDDNAMYKHWKSTVASEGNVFGICQYEGQSTRGIDEEGNTLEQSSYQMINSLPLSKKEIATLTENEKHYINKLKNDDDFFIEHVKKNANEVNSNMMLVELYERNSNIVNTKIFRSFRSAEVNRHVTHVKRGKIRLKGDYSVMVGNPVEMLKWAIGKFDVDKDVSTLKGNEIYSTMFEFDKKLVGFRNPNTSPSNVLVAHNTYNSEIERYVNVTDNIVVVNSIRFALLDKISGADYDGDSVLLFDNKTLLESAVSVQDYNVCINQIESEKRQYRLNESDMSMIDKTLQKSGGTIGEVVNLGQEIMSKYWNEGAKDMELMKMVDVATILSGVSIDLAKKMYDIDIQKEIKNVKKKAKLSNIKPEFFKYISQSKTIGKRIRLHDTAMDYLQVEMNGIQKAKYRNNLNFADLLVKHDKNKGNRSQRKKILNYVDEMNKKINYINVSGELKKEEKFEKVDNVIRYYDFYISKLKVKESTMYSMLDMIAKSKSNVALRLMNVLYNTQNEVFMKAFKEKVTKSNDKKIA